MRRAIPLLLLLSAPLRAEEVVETEHYTLHTEATPAEAQEMGRVLEAAWNGFKKYFGKKPRLKKGEKLVVRHFLTREPWAKAIAADGATPPAAGGYYWPTSRTAYLYRQPTKYYSRVLLLHEAAHQYHYLARTDNKEPTVYWYTEGVAEYLSWHNWDGRKLELGVVPTVSLKDYAAAALAEATGDGFDFQSIVDGTNEAPGRAVSWALYRWLATGGKKGKPLPKFDTYRRKMDKGNKPGSLFRKMFGQPKAVQPDFVDWLRKNQQPWEQVFNEWMGLGPNTLRGFSRTRSVCRLKIPVNVLEATMVIEGKAKGWRGGMMLHYENPKNFSMAVIDWAGFVHVARYVNGSWRTLEKGEVPAVDHTKNLKFQLFRKGDQVTMMIGPIGFGPWELPGRYFGLAVERSDVTFKDISWQ